MQYARSVYLVLKSSVRKTLLLTATPERFLNRGFRETKRAKRFCHAVSDLGATLSKTCGATLGTTLGATLGATFGPCFSAFSFHNA